MSVASLQLSIVHALVSAHVRFWTPRQRPAKQLSTSEQKSPSLQGVPFGPAGCVQNPPLQVSVVHALPSSVQGPVRFVKTQPLAGAQLSLVHSRPSLQTSGPPGAHCPAPLQASPMVQALLSSHEVVGGAGTFMQPVGSTQELVRHTVPPLHWSGVPDRQTAPRHVSLPLQTRPSEQELPSGTLACRQPRVGLHESTVQPFWSLHDSTRQKVEQPSQPTGVPD
jgi:hypothetical protein